MKFENKLINKMKHLSAFDLLSALNGRFSAYNVSVLLKLRKFIFVVMSAVAALGYATTQNISDGKALKKPGLLVMSCFMRHLFK